MKFLKFDKNRPEDLNRFKLLLGLMMIVSAFTCTGVLFYYMNTINMTKEVEIDDLETAINYLLEEKELVELDLENVIAQGDSIKLRKLLEEANSYYDGDEKARSEGLLWIDRESATLIVTLGALNGLEPGSRLQVYEGDEKIGFVTVDTPLDVISYVQLPENSDLELENDNYRVVME